MDRFKFRVWDKENNKYEDDLYYEAGDLQVTCVNKVFEEYISDGCIIEQCTGLKDNKGKLIYEGDIVRTSGNYEIDIYKVIWDEYDCEYKLIDRDGCFIYQLTNRPKLIEVIGNIHENADLLEVKND